MPIDPVVSLFKKAGPFPFWNPNTHPSKRGFSKTQRNRGKKTTTLHWGVKKSHTMKKKVCTPLAYTATKARITRSLPNTTALENGNDNKRKLKGYVERKRKEKRGG